MHAGRATISALSQVLVYYALAHLYVADVTAPHERARGMGMIGAAFGLGFIFGPAIGGVLSRYGHATPQEDDVTIVVLKLAA